MTHEICKGCPYHIEGTGHPTVSGCKIDIYPGEFEVPDYCPYKNDLKKNGKSLK